MKFGLWIGLNEDKQIVWDSEPEEMEEFLCAKGIESPNDIVGPFLTGGRVEAIRDVLLRQNYSNSATLTEVYWNLENEGKIPGIKIDKKEELPEGCSECGKSLPEPDLYDGMFGGVRSDGRLYCFNCYKEKMGCQIRFIQATNACTHCTLMMPHYYDYALSYDLFMYLYLFSGRNGVKSMGRSLGISKSSFEFLFGSLIISKPIDASSLILLHSHQCIVSWSRISISSSIIFSFGIKSVA